MYQRRPQWHDGAGGARGDCARRRTIDGPAIIAERTPPPSSSPAGSARVTALDHLVLDRAQPRQRAPRHRHHGRPGDAGGVQQPLHEHRRADGPAAAEHRLLGQHQGAAGLLVRAVRRRRQPDRQRAAHAGAPGLDGRVDQDRDREQRRPHAARRCVCAQRPVPRRHAPAGRHGDHAGVRPEAASTTLRSCSTSVRAVTMPTSAAPRRARCRRFPRASRKRAC